MTPIHVKSQESFQVNGCRCYTTPSVHARRNTLSVSSLAHVSLSKTFCFLSQGSWMATLQSMAFCFPSSNSLSYQSRSIPVSLCGSVHSSLNSSFNGLCLHLPQLCFAKQKQVQSISRLSTMMMKPTIQFIQGTDEQTIPDVRLTKSRDGTNGMAIFTFTEPSVFDSSSVVGDITGFYMIDEEGVIQSVDVNAKFVNGKPAGIEAKYIMRTPREWDRFMRFMERYSNQNGLSFIKK